MKMRASFQRRLSILLSILICAVLITLFLQPWTRIHVVTRDAIYLIRPLWDKPIRRPENIIPHFYADDLTREQLCKLHNWTPRAESDVPAVIDAVIFSIETDMLEIRLKELWPVVDKFVISEANVTLTGKPKPFFLEQEWDRFKWAKDKIVYNTFTGLSSPLPKGESPFFNEGKMRDHLATVIKDPKLGVKTGDIVIESDVDEIPSAKTIALLKSCSGYPNGLHLEMRNYLYSFEFYLDRENWKPHVSIYKRSSFSYKHSWSSDFVLADAGWHCSFCFRYLTQFAFKMLSYSHQDRVTNDRQLQSRIIQDKICRGADIFDMYPEAYTYKDLIWKMGNVPKTFSSIDIPQYVVQNADRFKYLLPGGCEREDLIK